MKPGYRFSDVPFNYIVKHKFLFHLYEYELLKKKIIDNDICNLSDKKSAHVPNLFWIENQQKKKNINLKF